MKNNNASHPVQLSTMKHRGDPKPLQTVFTIEQIWQQITKPRIPADGGYEDFHTLKAIATEIAETIRTVNTEAKALKADGMLEEAAALEAQSTALDADLLDAEAKLKNAKDAFAYLPFIHHGGKTWHVETKNGRNGTYEAASRWTANISHFGAILLDIESGATAEDIDTTFSAFEFIRYPSISMQPGKPRWRVILFLEEPVSLATGQNLMFQADSMLPALVEGKRMLCIDKSNADIGRLMYGPQWFADHPLQWESLIHWNHGQLLNAADAFGLTPSRVAEVYARIAAFDKAPKGRQAPASSRSTPRNATAASAALTINGKDYLDPDGYLDLSNGQSVLVSAIDGHIPNVICPFHTDNKGSEFVKVNGEGTPYLRCGNCGTIWMWREKVAPETTLTLAAPKAKAPAAPIDVLKLNVLQVDASSTERDEYEEAEAHNTVRYFDTDDVVKRLDERFLPAGLSQFFPKQGVTVIRSPKGTGKTVLIGKFIREHQGRKLRVLLLGHRILLLRAIAEALHMDFYQDLDPKQYGKSDNLALCINSLPKLDPMSTKPYDVVIIDESEQVLQQLQSNTVKRELPKIFKAFDWCVRTSKQLMVLDADLSTELTLDLLLLVRGYKPEDRYLGIDNVYKIGKGHTTLMYEKEPHLIAKMFDDVVNNDVRGFMTCNSAALATQMHAMFSSFGKRALLVTADTSSRPDVQAFIASPRQEAFNYDVICTSPTLSTGVSIDALDGKPVFERVYGFFNQGDISTFQDVDQSLARVRECNDVHVWVQGNKDAFVSPTREEYRKELMRKLEDMLMATYDEVPVISEGQKKWAQITAIINHEVTIWKRNKDVQFVNLRQKLGYDVQMIMADKEAQALGKELLKRFKDVGSIRGEEIFNARELAANEYFDLLEKQTKISLEHEEFLAVTRYKFNEMAKANGIPFDLEFCIRLDEEGFMGRMKNWRLRAHTEVVELKAMERRAHHYNPDQFTAWDTLTLDKSMMQNLLNAAHIDPEDIRQRIAAGEELIPISIDRLNAMAEVYAGQQAAYNRTFGLTIKDPINNHKRVWDAVIGKPMGLPLVKKKRGPAGQQVATYFIDGTAFALTLALATKQNTTLLHELNTA